MRAKNERRGIFMTQISRPETWNSAVLVELNQPLVVTQLYAPRRLGFGQVLVKIFVSGVCASQVNEADGRRGSDPYLPHLLGHEAVGEVVDVGQGVSRFAPGDKVIAHWRQTEGIDAGPLTIESDIGPVSAGQITTFGEYSIISENRLTPMPTGIDTPTGVMLGCSLTTGFGAVTNEAQVSAGESAVIFGLGSVGTAVLKTLQLAGAHPVGVVDISPQKVALAKEYGADVVVDLSSASSSQSDFVADELGFRPDVVFECTGNKDAIEAAYDLLHNSGRLVLVGVPRKDTPASLDTLGLHLGKRIIGSHGGSTVPSRDIPRIAGLVRDGLLETIDIAATTITLSEVNEGLNLLRKGTLGRVLIQM